MVKKRQRLPAQIMTVQVEKFSHDGRGIARVNGKTTFLQGALPGETVSFRYTRVKKAFDEGIVTEVMNASSQRAEPACPHYQLCGGCSLQHLDEQAQIHEKQALLLDSLQRIGHLQPQTLLAPLTSASWNYRNKARLSVRFVEKKQATMVGFRERNKPGYVTQISQCPVLHQKVDANIGALRSLIDSLDNPGTISQIEVAAGDEDIALVFRNIAALSSADQQKLKDFAKTAGFKLFLQPGDEQTVIRIYPEDGDDYLHYTLPVENISFRFHPVDFTQINAGLNSLMVTQALSLLDLNSQDVVADLYCGLGNFSLPIARHCKKVIGIEGSGQMVERAMMNAAQNGITNCSFYCADLNQVDSISEILQEPVSKMLLDPPRTGALEIVRQAYKLKVKRLVYVSCNPATLARDADILVNQQGYSLKAAGVMDMFPHTAHVESIALFEKG